MMRMAISPRLATSSFSNIPFTLFRRKCLAPSHPGPGDSFVGGWGPSVQYRRQTTISEGGGLPRNQKRCIRAALPGKAAPPARVVESGAAGRAVSAMREEKRGRKGMLTSATPSLPTGAFQGTLHSPSDSTPCRPWTGHPDVRRQHRHPAATTFPLSPGWPLQSASKPGNGRRLAL